MRDGLLGSTRWSVSWGESGSAKPFRRDIERTTWLPPTGRSLSWSLTACLATASMYNPKTSRCKENPCIDLHLKHYNLLYFIKSYYTIMDTSSLTSKVSSVFFFWFYLFMYLFFRWIIMFLQTELWNLYLSIRCNYSEIELLFQLVRAFTGRFLCNMTFLKEYMEEEIPRKYSIAQKRALFFRFVEFNDPHFNDELKAKVR